MHHKEHTDPKNTVSFGYCLTELSTMMLIALAIGVSAFLWLAILAVL